MNDRDTTALRAGFAEVDITPAPGLRLGGMPDAPVATGVRWPLRGRVALFDDGSRRIAVLALDLIVLEQPTVAEWRAALAAAGGLEPADVLLSCTHTHRGPHSATLIDFDRDDDYLDWALVRLTAATEQAAGALRPAELRVGSAQAPGWAFNRRPMYRGGEVGTAGPEWVEEFERPEGLVDHELQVLLALDAESGATLGGLVNFACHPTSVHEDPVYSADFPGPLTERLAQRHGGVFGFLQGASGDVGPNDLTAPGAYRKGFEHAEALGRALADAADAAIASSRSVPAPRLRRGAELLEIAQRRPTREQVELARWYLAQEQGSVDERDFTRRIYGHDHTFYEPMSDIQTWFAREAIGMWEWQRRSGTRLPADRLEVTAIALGDVALVAYPAEMFAAFGAQTKLESPFATTIVCGIANGWHGYVPTPIAFEHGGYEPRLAYTSRLVPEAGDRMVGAALGLLDQLREQAASGASR